MLVSAVRRAFTAVICKLDVLRHQRFLQPLPFGSAQTDRTVEHPKARWFGPLRVSECAVPGSRRAVARTSPPRLTGDRR